MTCRENVTQLLSAAHFAGNFVLLTDHASVESAMNDVDELVRRALEHKRSLQEHGNTLVPVARFPPEILSYIFRYCAPTPACVDTGCSILAFSQVCRRWRGIALQDASIWTTPICIYPTLGELMLARSEDLPLDITIDCADDTACYDLARVALTRCSQLERLDLAATAQDLQKLILGVPHSIPLLTDLTLRSEGTILLQIPDLIAPNLRQLRLYFCTVPPNARILRNLTVLEIELSLWRIGGRIDSGDIIDIIKQNPRLQTLELKCATAGWENFLSPSGDKTTLPSLKTLILADSVPCICAIFQHFSLPALRDLCLENILEGTLPDIRPLLERLDQWLRADIPHKCIQGFGFSVTDANAIELSMQCDDDNILLESETNIKAFFHSGDGNILSAIESLPGTFQLDNVVQAVISTGSTHWHELCPVVKTLAAVPLLDTLQLIGDAWLSWLKVMKHTKWNNPPFRALASLAVIKSQSYGPQIHTRRKKLKEFARVLQRFQEAGRPVGEIVLVGLRPAFDAHAYFESMGLPVLSEGQEIVKINHNESDEDSDESEVESEA